MQLVFKTSNLSQHNTPTLQTDGQTDRRTTCNHRTAICTIVHRAVKHVPSARLNKYTVFFTSGPHFASLLLLFGGVRIVVLVGATSPKMPKAPLFSNWIGMKSGKTVLQLLYSMIDGVGFSISRHTFKPAAIDAEKCCHLVNQNEASVACLCSSVRQFLI